MCLLIRHQAKVQTLRQTSPTKRNMKKYIFWGFPLSRFLTKALKIKKISRSGSTLNCRSRHSCIKLTLMWCEKLGRNPNWRVVIMYVRMYVLCVYACQSHHSAVGSVLDVKPGFVSQVRHQNEIWKKKYFFDDFFSSNFWQKL